VDFAFEKVYENEFISIEIDNNLDFIQVVWLQHPDSDTFRQCYAQATELALIRNCRFWLSDARAVHYLEFADQNWFLHFMVPLLRSSRLLKYARINSEESLSMLDTDRILQQLDLTKGRVGIFLERAAALDWLFPVNQLQENGCSPQCLQATTAADKRSKAGTA
jgi:hypothetical protein